MLPCLAATRRRSALSFVALLLPFASGTPGLAQEDSLDVTTYGVVLQEPAMAQAVVRHELRAGDVGFEVTTPHAPQPGESFPGVVFVNVGGADYRSWKIYTDWARLVAARGMAGVVYQASASDAGASLATLVDYLVAHGGELGVDSGRLALWACSANVTTALPYLMGKPPAAVRGAVLYYGSTPAPALRRDLPVFYLLSERDNPSLNEGIRTLWRQAVETSAPWTMVVATGMPHAFDALVQTRAARDLVEETLGFLRLTLAAPSAPDPAPSLVRQAVTAGYANDWPAAAAAYAKLAEARPDDVEVLRGLGMSLLRSGRGGEAVEPLRLAITKDPDRSDLHDMLGGALLMRGENVEGVAELERALPGAGSFRRGAILYNLACGYARLGRLDDALTRLEAAAAAGFATRKVYTEDPDLAPLRGNARFTALVAKLPPG